MFFGLSAKFAKEMETQGLTYNAHHYGVSTKTFEEDEGLKSFWDVTSYSLMPNGTEFVATIEAKDYPMFAT